jgi:hypothetical protein
MLYERIIPAKFMGVYYPLYHNFTLVTEYTAVPKPESQISELSVVMPEYGR